jgi:hypothetical protein
VDALNDIHAKVLPIYNGSTGWTGEDHVDQIALDTGAAIDDVPLTFIIPWDGSGLDTSVVEAVQSLVSGVPMDISVVARDDETDSVDATIFVDNIVPNIIGGVADPTDPTVVCVGGLDTADTDSDPEPDMFVDVLPGTPVCFDIYPAMNVTVPETPDPQLYRCYVDVVGDSVTVLDTREVFFLVPPSGPIVE